jgi:hypothetical protein
MLARPGAGLLRAGFVLARLCVAVILVLTVGYCLLAYIPFTYQQVVVGDLLPWLTAFARFHAYFYWAAFVLASSTLPLRHRGTRLASILFVLVYGAIGIVLVVRPVLVRLENDLQSLLWALVALTPLVWLGALDWIAQRSSFKWPKQESSETARLFRAFLFSAVYAWLFSAVLVIVRYRAFSVSELRWSRLVLVSASSLLFHLLVLMVIFLAVNFAGAVAGIFSKNLAVHSLFYAGSAVVLLMLALKLIVFAPLSFYGQWSTGFAFAVAFSVVLFLSGTSVRLYRSETGEIESPVALLLLPGTFLRALPRPVQAGILVAASAIAAWMLISVSTIDWEHLIQRLLMAAIWAGGFSFFYLTAPTPRDRSSNSLIIAAAALGCLYLGFISLPPKWQLSAGKQALDEYAGYDVSFSLTRAILSPPAVVADEDSFYAFLVQNTNIPRSSRSEPVDINLAGKLIQTPGPKPNIFIFVIDSLRRDYVSAYNPAVNFTPNIEAFAHESIVVPNAFTRYTGTGLSEPSIWTGAMLLHKQYITPFYPMNSLQKLLEFEQYQQFIAKDTILSDILAPSKLVTDLDAGRTTMNLRMCPALNELQTRLTAAASAGRPMFAYAQPQDIHVSVINREGRSVPRGESYPGFDAPYASRVKAVDRCFGDFIQLLKSRGLYDNTILILTSDHGDSLGEQGRWGHAYHVTPEVARIPLIIHLPRAMRALSFDRAAPTFLTDITPSLYYLLGHRPIARNDLFGRPLFTTTPEEAASYLRSSYLVASSYGPVYGLLENSGHSLYVADAVEYDDHFYEWGEGKRVTSDTITSEIRADHRKQIRDYVNEIAKFYNFPETDNR